MRRVLIAFLLVSSASAFASPSDGFSSRSRTLKNGVTVTQTNLRVNGQVNLSTTSTTIGARGYRNTLVRVGSDVTRTREVVDAETFTHLAEVRHSDGKTATLERTDVVHAVTLPVDPTMRPSLGRVLEPHLSAMTVPMGQSVRKVRTLPNGTVVTRDSSSLDSNSGYSKTSATVGSRGDRITVVRFPGSAKRERLTVDAANFSTTSTYHATE